MAKNKWNKYWSEKSNWDYWLEPDHDVVKLLNSLDKTKVRDVLDLGCGIGRHALFLAEAGFSATATDTSEQALSILQESANARGLRVRTIQHDFGKDIFAPDSFDFVLAYNVIYHGCKEDFQNAIYLVHKWLKPQGLFFFTCPSQRDAKFGSGEKVAPNAYRSLNSIHPGDIHYFATEGDILHCLRKFSIVSKEIREHYWDNNGTRQLASYWHILARKSVPRIAAEIAPQTRAQLGKDGHVFSDSVDLVREDRQR